MKSTEDTKFNRANNTIAIATEMFVNSEKEFNIT